MSRLPTVGGDNDAWGTILNDYLTESSAIATLSSDSSASDTTIDVAVTIPGLVSGTVVAIDAFTTECELRSVSSVSNNTVTLDTALKFGHSSGDTVLVVGDHVRTSWFGLLGDGTNEWGPLQRMFRESTAYGGLEMRGAAGTYYLSQPILIGTGSRIHRLTLQSHSGFSPVDSNNAMICVGNRDYFFTATASDDTITTDTSHSLSIGDQISFCAPYGETFPGGMTEGQVYYVKTVPTGTTMTISATSGGSAVNITSDGAGWSVSTISDLTRIFWESLRLNINVEDLNGIIVGPQQPSWTRNLRIDMSTAASSQGAAFGASIGGQLSYHDNMEINPAANCIGLIITGTGISIRGINSVGDNSNDTGIDISGGRHSLSDIWTEQCGRAGVEISASMKGLSIDGYWLVSSSSPTTSPMLLVSDSASSYAWNAVARCTSSSQLLLDDTARSITITGSEALDSNNVFFGYVQEYGDVAPIFNYQNNQFSSATSVTASRFNRHIKVTASGGDTTVNLPTAVGWLGEVFTVKHSGSANNVTIDPSGTQTIDGSATKVLTAGQFTTLLSDGANWHTIG